MACAFPEDAPNLDAKATDISYEDDSGPVIKGSFSGEQIDFDPEPEERFKVPKKKSPKKIVRVPGAQLRWILLHLDNTQYMKQFIKKHIETLCWAQEMKNNFLDVLKIFAPPDTKFREDMEPETLMNILKDVLQHYQRRVAMLDVTVDKIELLEGTALKCKIEDSSRKVGDLLESYETKMNAAEDNLMMLDDIIKQEREEKRIIIDHLATKVDQLYNALLCLEGRTSDQPTTTQEEFFKELKEHLEQDIRLNSTLLNSSALKEELAEEKRKKHILFREICTLKEDRILEEEQKMREIAELARDFQLEDGIKKEIVAKIKTLTADPDEVYKAVEDWMETTRSSIANKEGEIERLKKTLKDKEDEITDLRELNIKTNEEKHQYENIVLDLISECNKLLEEFNTKQQQLIDLDNGIDELDSKIRSQALSLTRYYDARSTLDSMRHSPSSSPTRYYDARSMLEGSPETMVDFFGESSRSRSGSPHSPGYNNKTPKSAMHSPELKDLSGCEALGNSTQQLFQMPDEVDASGSYSLSVDESPEKLRHGSPYRGGTYFDDSNPTSIHSTPLSASPQYCVTPPSPFYMSSPLMQSYGESGVIVESPGTERISGPKSKFAPRTSTFYPNTPSKVSNRFDIGKSFNLRTTCETSTPYQQVTRVESFIPESGYSGRVMEHPLLIMHSGEITPTQYMTPFISQSRFGYTDPTARFLNMPPDLELFKQVTPSQQEQGISPDVVTYGTPPAVTPTTTRRHGLFTPKGIFRKKHFNVRRIFEPDYFDSPEYSESQYLPDYFPSPARLSSFSPIYSDKSLSWEQHYNNPYDENIMNKTFQVSPAMDRTFDATTSRTINRTFVASPSGAMNKTYDRSPASAMDRTVFASSPYVMDRTFDRSPVSARNRTFDASPACAMNKTFDSPPASAMDRTFVASSPYAMDSTFDRSPISARNRTFDTSPACAMDRTFDRSPVSARNRTFDAPPACAMNKTFDRPPASAMDRTFVSSSPYAMDSTFDRSPISARNRTFDRSPISARNRTFDTSPACAMDRTFDRSPVSARNRTFDASPACAMNKTFDRPPASAMDRTFVASSPYAMDSTFDRSPISARNRTFDTSPACAMNRTFDRSPPSAIDRTFVALSLCATNKTFDTYPALAMDRTFDASSPSLINRTFNSTSPYTLNKTFDASPSYAMNRTYNKSLSSPFGRTFQQSPSLAFPPYATNRTFDRTRMPSVDRTFDASSPQTMNRTFNTSSPHALNTTFGVSPSYAMNKTFNKSLSSPLGRTFQQRQTVASSPYDMNRTFDASLPQPMNKTFDASSLHNLNTTFGVSPQYTMNRTFNKSYSSPIGRTFHQGPSH